ncbi:MAG: hypothetical protein ACRD3M_03530, partial [Thermoanaerobaculia bacterium]
MTVPPDEIVREENTDTYLLIPGADVNLKLREDGVSCKPICAREGLFTGYRQKLRHLFPIAPDALVSLMRIPIQDTVRTSGEFLDLVLHQEPRTKVVTVRKSRRKAQFRIHETHLEGFTELKAEFSILRIGETEFQTFCLEC